jgi:ethanolamine kinase
LQQTTENDTNNHTAMASAYRQAREASEPAAVHDGTTKTTVMDSSSSMSVSSSSSGPTTTTPRSTALGSASSALRTVTGTPLVVAHDVPFNWVDGLPYVPTRFADLADPQSIQRVVALLLQATLSNTYSTTPDSIDHAPDQPPSVHSPNPTPPTSTVAIAPDDWNVIYSSFQLEQVAGGITNTLVRVTNLSSFFDPRTTPDSVLVRIFGAVGLIDRDEETHVLARLAVRGIAPAYYGRFGNGRLEAWRDGMRALATYELGEPDKLVPIAREVARLHHTHLHDIDRSDADNESTPQNNDNNDSITSTHEPTLWTQLYDWYDQALVATASTKSVTLELSSYRAELDWVRSLTPPDTPIAFCHNDLLAANILYNDNPDPTDPRVIQLIDFEYGGTNYVAFDIANHFNEFAGGPPTHPVPDYDNLPTPAQQLLFAETYLEQEQELQQQPGATTTAWKSARELLDHVRIFALANHLYWGLWAVNQAATEGCDAFDYRTYAVNRLKQYHVVKQEYADSTAINGHV